MLTYGDGVSDVDISQAAGVPSGSHGKQATLTAVMHGAADRACLNVGGDNAVKDRRIPGEVNKSDGAADQRRLHGV